MFGPRKSLDSVTKHAEGHALAKTLSWPHLIALGVGAIVGVPDRRTLRPRDHPGILIVGLIFAVALMGIAANVIARYIERYRWIAYVGLIVGDQQPSGLASHPRPSRRADERPGCRTTTSTAVPVSPSGSMVNSWIGSPFSLSDMSVSFAPPGRDAVTDTSGNDATSI